MLPLIAAAIAAPPPHLDLEDVDAWEASAFALSRGPVGTCWELTGAVAAEVAMYQAASVFSSGGHESLAGRGTFSGRLEDGVWTSFSYRMAGEDGGLGLPVIPLTGSIDPTIIENENDDDDDDDDRSRTADASIEVDDPIDTVSLLRDSIHQWFSSSITTSFMRWNDPRSGAELVIEVPTSDQRNAPVLTATAFFPGGGQVATELDSVLPQRLVLGSWPLRIKIMDGQLHLRGQVIDGLLLPSQESWSALLGFAGITVGYEQRLIYSTISECTP